MKIHQKVEVSHIRVYEDHCSYDNKDEYLAIFTVHILGDREAWVSGAKGIMNRGVYRALQNFFISQGIFIVRYEKSKPNGIHMKEWRK